MIVLATINGFVFIIDWVLTHLIYFVSLGQLNALDDDGIYPDKMDTAIQLFSDRVYVLYTVVPWLEVMYQVIVLGIAISLVIIAVELALKIIAIIRG